MLRCQQEKVENWRGNGKRGEVVPAFHLHPYGMHLENEGFSHGLKNSPPDCFSTWLCRGRPFESTLPIYQKSRHPNGGRSGSPFPSTSLRDASGNGGTLPRAKKVSTGHFLTSDCQRTRFFETNVGASIARPPKNRVFRVS